MILTADLELYCDEEADHLERTSDVIELSQKALLKKMPEEITVPMNIAFDDGSKLIMERHVGLDETELRIKLPKKALKA